jgi:hypothetical protein
MRRKVLAAAGFFLGAVCNSFGGPFGFEPGMTKARVLELVGKEAVRKDDEDSLVLTTAPQPHTVFETYVLLFSPQKGLVKILAVSKDIRTSVYGDEVKQSFSDISDALAKAYGTGQKYDYLRTGSIWNEAEDWMMGLLKQERVLASVWTFDPPRGQILSIGLEAGALSREGGYLHLSYEFVGFAEYLESKKKDRDKVF